MKYIQIIILIKFFYFLSCLGEDNLRIKLNIKDKINIGYKVKIEATITAKNTSTFVDEYGVLLQDDKKLSILKLNYLVEVLEIDKNNNSNKVKIIFEEVKYLINNLECSSPLSIGYSFILIKKENGYSIVGEGKNLGAEVFNYLFLFPTSYSIEYANLKIGKEEKAITVKELAEEELNLIKSGGEFLKGSSQVFYEKVDNLVGTEFIKSVDIRALKFKLKDDALVKSNMKSYKCETKTETTKLFVKDSYTRYFKNEITKITDILFYDKEIKAFGNSHEVKENILEYNFLKIE